MNFNKFRAAVAKQFASMQKHPLFRVDADQDAIWDLYLNSFPAGSDNLFRDRTEHNCTCCRHFIRDVGSIIQLKDNKYVTVWDVTLDDEPEYQIVADALSVYVRSRAILSPFVSATEKAGTDVTRAVLDGSVTSFTHFFVNISPNFVMRSGVDRSTFLNQKDGDFGVFKRSLEDFSVDIVEEVLDLISQNSIYRGAEYKAVLEQFVKFKKKYEMVPAGKKTNFVWQTVMEPGSFGSLLRIRNTAIGTLLDNLAKGMAIEDAVKVFESVVAPANYRRPTAVATKSMVERAKKELDELGLLSALSRRHASISDVTVNNILFADSESRTQMADAPDVFDQLASSVSNKAKNFDGVEQVPIEEFLKSILPRAQKLEVLLETRHKNNLVSLITAEDPTAGNLFKWSNSFSWSYAGGVTDAVKERVKAAGGVVDADFCCRLSWYSPDDLDLHMVEPNSSYEIYYGNRSTMSPCGGKLDVDMNAWEIVEEPVENIFYKNIKKMRPGTYTLVVNNFNKRAGGTKGFDVDVEIMGQTYHFNYPNALNNRENVTVAEFKYDPAKGLALHKAHVSTSAGSSTSVGMWGIPSGEFVDVSVLMMSPNFWDDQVGIGNKHYFFMLKNCVCDEVARPFYNEFLRSDLNTHRLVMELVGSKIQPAASDKQLSGLGFSCTIPAELTVRVTGATKRVLKITF